MRKKLYTIILLSLIVSSEFVFGKDSNKTKTHKENKSHNHFKDKSNNERIKRSLDENDETFWANRGKKETDDTRYNNQRNDNNQDKIPKILEERDVEDEPFWGTRGRRKSASVKNQIDEEYPENDNLNCIDCYGTIHRFNNKDHNLKSFSDDSVETFSGVRGRRDSNEIDDPAGPFWGNRGRRQENDPFWGMRGRRKYEPFWGARGRRDDEPFWGNRGRRDDNDPFWGMRGRRKDEPFWGARGRRDDEPLWGNRGRQDDDEPFWGNRGKRKEEDLLWGDHGKRKEDLKETILSAINNVENDIEHLSRLKKSESSFWSNRGRDSKLRTLFSAPRSKIKLSKNRRDLNLKNTDPRTMTDSRIYADEPNYILVERSSRSSGEVDDPFFITRGKKERNLNFKLFKAARDRRGALEEIVKSVRNDPYYIARGKKEDIGNYTSRNGDLYKVKELICSAIDLVSVNENGKVKREIDTDRDRRTILKKLTAQLQNDPYFVSRGKKSDNVNNEGVHEFITEIAKKC